MNGILIRNFPKDNHISELGKLCDGKYETGLTLLASIHNKKYSQECKKTLLTKHNYIDYI